MTRPEVYADFQNLDDANRLKLTCAGTRHDLERLGIQLHEGCLLTFYMDDADEEGRPDELLADGTVHYNPQEHCWVAEIDWTAMRHRSDERSASPPPTNGSRAQAEVENRQTKHLT